MGTIEQPIPTLKRLKLSGTLQSLELRIGEAVDDNLPAHKLLSQLRAARAAGSYDRKLHRFAHVELLIIDDLGLHPLRGDEPGDLYELIRLRYEHGSMVVTSNRDVVEWYPMFGDELLASAAMDRLLHHAQVLVLEGASYRNPPSKKRSKAA